MKIFKNPVFMFILGVVTCTITTVIASSLIASNISYTPLDKTWGVTNVGAALDSLMLSKTSDNYSLDEKVVGTWIDGKPMYQKTIHYTNSPFRLDQLGTIVVGNVKNIDSLIFSSATTTGNNKDSQETGFLIARYDKPTNNIIVLNVAGGYSNITRIDVTIQYTKTTD